MGSSSSWGATAGISPLEEPDVKAVAAAQRRHHRRIGLILSQLLFYMEIRA